jgi:hypothetical protein
MKKVILFCLVLCGGVYAAAVPDATVAIAPAGTDIMALVKDVLIVVVTVFGAVLTAALPMLLKAVLGHFGIASNSAEFQMIDAAAENAASHGLQWASTQTIQPTHNATIDAAMSHLNEVLDDKLIQAYGIVPLRNWVGAKITAAAAPTVAVAAPVAAAAVK